MLLDELVTTIEKLKARIERHQTELRKSEALTRYALIDPLLRELGWDTSDPALVMPEYDVDGKRADYALLEGDKVVVFLEAKRLDEPLANHRDQVTNYANNLGIRYPVLTNGNQWEVYDNTKLVPIAEKRVLNISLTNAPASALALQLLLLWRPNLASGQPVAASEPILANALQTTPATPEPIVHTPIPVPPTPAPANNEGWTPLAGFRPETNQSLPSTIRFPDGDEKQPDYWNGVIIQVAEYLIRTGKLTSGRCPVPVPYSPRYVVHTEAVHFDGRAFTKSRRLSNGLFCEVDVKRGTAVTYANSLLQHCGVDAGQVWLKFNPYELRTTPATPEPIVPTPISVLPTPAPANNEGWTPLAGFRPETNQSVPSTIRFPNGEERQPSYWNSVILQAAEYLIKTGKLTSNRCPVPVPYSTRYVVHTEAVHSNGKAFTEPRRLSNGLFCEVDVDRRTAVTYANSLLQHCGEDLASTWLKLNP